MNRGPAPGTRSEQRSFVEKAMLAWGEPCPPWVVALAELADSRRLKAAGEAIGYSGSLVSTVLSNAYQGDIDKVRQKVMGALMGETVQCPGLGHTMSRKTCLDWQDAPGAGAACGRDNRVRVGKARSLTDDRDAKAFEDMLVSASFALAEARLNILAYQRETDRLQVDAQQQLDHSAAVLRETVSLFDRLLGAPAPPIVPSKILVFTGSYRPVPANDVPAPGGAA
mgnify:CR=1 FL=1